MSRVYVSKRILCLSGKTLKLSEKTRGNMKYLFLIMILVLLSAIVLAKQPETGGIKSVENFELEKYKCPRSVDMSLKFNI